MRKRLIKFIASGFGVGYAPVAPGTVGSLLGVGYWWLLTRGNVWVYWLVFAAGVVFAVWCAGEAAEALRRPDPPCVVIDEIAAMPLALAGLGVQPWKIVVGVRFVPLVRRVEADARAAGAGIQWRRGNRARRFAGGALRVRGDARGRLGGGTDRSPIFLRNSSSWLTSKLARTWPSTTIVGT